MPTLAKRNLAGNGDRAAECGRLSPCWSRPPVASCVLSADPLQLLLNVDLNLRAGKPSQKGPGAARHLGQMFIPITVTAESGATVVRR